MRWSQALIPTLREVPKDAEIPSHQLLLRAGMIRQLAGGIYTFLPLGLRVLRKVEQIVREEMDRAGALEVLMPALHPREIWEQTGRAATLNEILFKVKDRTDREFVLGPTHEEIVTSLVAAEVRSYKQLPKNIYQIQTKFRDEPRPRFGLIRVKEFLMKDAYSFDADDAGADRSYQTMYEAYKRIFARCGLKTIDVEAHSGAMGGSHSHEFMVVSPAGEDHVARCDKCDYAANLEKAASRIEHTPKPVPIMSLPVEEFSTPGVHTIDDLTKPPYNVPTHRQIKTLIYRVEAREGVARFSEDRSRVKLEQMTHWEFIAFLLRGDHQLNEAKMLTATNGQVYWPATPDEIRRILGASPGSLGMVGISHLPVYADESLKGLSDMVTGANKDNYHLCNVEVDRDIKVTKWCDLRVVKAGEGCPKCEGTLTVDSAIEVGHVFKLGTKYSVALGANYLDEKGASQPMIMGCYGIGVSRTVAAIVEQCHDDKGICWPRAVAPYEVAILALNVNHAETMRVAEELYAQLTAASIDTILDDRTDRPGVKFNDADLAGFPLRVTVGEKSLAKGVVEIKGRSDPQVTTVPPAEVVAVIRASLANR